MTTKCQSIVLVRDFSGSEMSVKFCQILGVNCTKEELDNVTTNFPDTELVGYTGNLSYAVTYK